MKLDWDLLRTILIELESMSPASLHSDDLPPYPPQTVAFHFKLLGQSGWIDAIDVSGPNGFDLIAKHINPGGMAMLKVMRHEDDWAAIKELIASKGLDLGINAIQAAADALNAQQEA